MTYSLRIEDLPENERPRERLLAIGARNLTTAELLAILLGTGQGKGKLSALGLGQHLLQQLSKHKRDPVDTLRDVSPQELMQISGIGPAKAATIVAAVELGKRTFQFRPNQRATIDNPAAAVAALSQDLMWQNQERFAVLMLDGQNGLMGTQIITIGTATETVVDPRAIFRESIKQGANKLIVAHNHPSGVLEPSPEDLELTEQLLKGAEYLDIPILDHLILGNGNHKSIRNITNFWND